MELERQSTPPAAPQMPEFAEPTTRESLELRLDIPPDSEAAETRESLSPVAVETAEPVKRGRLSAIVKAASKGAIAYFTELAETDLDRISDTELQPARIQVGLAFVGFGALTILLLLVYVTSLHPDMSAVERIRSYWYQYIWFVGLGVAGMFLLARESIRPKLPPVDESEKQAE